jgi:hypothetical protein
VSLLVRAVFGVLVGITFLGFFVVNRLKHSPAIVQRVMLTPTFSPTVGAPDPLERISFRIKQTDDVSVTIVDSRGDPVATLTHAYHLRRYTQLQLGWNGRTDSGAPAPAGTYQVRITLLSQARSVIPPRTFDLVANPGAARANRPDTISIYHKRVHRK